MDLIKKSSNVYYCEGNIKVVDDKFIEQLLKVSQDNSQDLFRCCLHKDESSSLMSMLIIIRNKFIYPAHRHAWKDETYTLIKGSCIYEEYDDRGKIKSQVNLKEGDHLLNQNKTFHLLRPLTDTLVFIENTIGPFRKNQLEFL